jgi:hypothetical protein
MNPTEELDDLQAAAGMLDEMGAEPFDYSAPEGFDGGLEALKGFMRPSAGAGRSLLMAGAPFPIFADKAESLVTGKETTAHQEKYFSEVVEGLGGNAVEEWTPDPVIMSGTAKTINMVGNVVGSIPQMIGTPGLFLANAGVDPAVDLTKQGVSTEAALGVGAVNLAVNALGMRLPAAFGTGLTTRLATGAGSNLALGVAADASSAGILTASGATAQAEGYDLTDPYARGLDTLMGLAFGAIHVPAAARDAVLVARNADHIERTSMPGTPVTKGADLAHQTAMTSAISQVLRGEQVNITDAINPADFLLKPNFEGMPPSRMQGPGFAGALERLFKTEGGYVNDPVDSGGETNFGISKAANPDIDVANLTRAQAAQIYKARYWDMIEADKLPGSIQETAFDAAVNQGVPWTRNALKVADGDSAKFNDLREARYRTIVARDPEQAKFLRGWLNRLGRQRETNDAGRELRDRLVMEPDKLAVDYAALADSEGGTVLNTDVARELSPEYLADRTRSADVHEAASDTVKTLYARKLAEPTPEGREPVVMFTAGGTGAGKTTAIAQAGDALGKPEIIYDTNMNSLASSVEKVEQALAAGRDVRIAYVYRDPVEALTGGAIPRAQRQAAKFGSGRTVPLVEHAKTHSGVRSVIEALAKKYENDPRVDIRAIDNSRGKGQAKLTTVDELPKVDDNGLAGKLKGALDEARQAGLEESIYRGFAGEAAEARPAELGAGDGRRTEPEDGQAVDQPAGDQLPPMIAAAAKLVARNPTQTVIVGSDADGNPIMRTLAEEADSIAADRQAAIREAEGITAAANCFTSRGMA